MQNDRSECAICGVALSPLRASRAVLCESLRCAHTHAALPPEQKCANCTRPVPAGNRAARHCGRSDCAKVLLVDGPLRAEQQRRAMLKVTSVARRRRAGAQRGLSAAESESYAVALVPRNYDRVSKLPARRAGQFETHLRLQLSIARQRLNVGLAVEPLARWDGVLRELTAPETALLGAGCAACRGYCCRLGETHAFVRPDTVARYIERFPDKSDESIVADYLQHLAARTLTKGCVFQLANGCALPRDMRSDTCNTFLCDGLIELRDNLTQLQRGGSSVPLHRAFYVNVDGYQARGGVFVDIPTPAADEP